MFFWGTSLDMSGCWRVRQPCDPVFKDLVVQQSPTRVVYIDAFFFEYACLSGLSLGYV